MKRLIAVVFVGSALAVCLSLSGFIGTEPSFSLEVFAGGGGGTSQSLHFDGFCDGVTLTRLPGSPVVNGAFCGCITASAIGTLTGSGADLALTLHPNEAEAGGVVQYIIRADRTWALYSSYGLLNSGTWSRGCPLLLDDDLRPSTLDGLFD